MSLSLSIPKQLQETPLWMKTFGLFSIGWAVLYLPAYFDLAAHAWTRDENAHAPFLFAFSCGAIFVKLNQLHRQSFLEGINPSKNAILSGSAVLLIGLILFTVGRLGQVELLTSGSQIFVLSGIILLAGGGALLRQLAVPVALVLYLIVWPGWMLNELTGPLKHWVSTCVAELLYSFGVPVARSGVLLAVGQYELLVADACSGLNSLLALTATGAIYLYMSGPRTWRRSLIIFALTIPIAIIANIIRVMVLVLLTYWGGYDLGQGFAHDFAGLFLYGIALLMVFAVDTFVSHVGKRTVICP